MSEVLEARKITKGTFSPEKDGVQDDEPDFQPIGIHLDELKKSLSDEDYFSIVAIARHTIRNNGETYIPISTVLEYFIDNEYDELCIDL